MDDKRESERLTLFIGIFLLGAGFFMIVNFTRTSLYEYVLMLGTSAAGTGLIIRVLRATDKLLKK